MGIRCSSWCTCKAAKSEERKPAGVFYYNIKDVSVNVEGSKDASEVVDSELKKGLI